MHNNENEPFIDAIDNMKSAMEHLGEIGISLDRNTVYKYLDKLEKIHNSEIAKAIDRRDTHWNTIIDFNNKTHEMFILDNYIDTYRRSILHLYEINIIDYESYLTLKETIDKIEKKHFENYKGVTCQEDSGE